MSYHSMSIVPRQSSYPGNEEKATEILNWLVSLDIVKPTLSDCILSVAGGYAVSNGAKKVMKEPEYLPFDYTTNGLEVITEREVFHSGGNGVEEIICPNCKKDISAGDWDFITDWSNNKNTTTCPLCNIGSDIHDFKFEPQWGFSDLGFTFWGWTEFTEDFIKDFREKLGCDVDIVYCKV